jgi:hypothetical protein
MAVTVDQTIITLDKVILPLFTAANLDGNDLLDYQASISRALLELGYTVTDITNPTNAELTAVTDAAQYLDLVEIKLLEIAQTRLVIKVNLSTGPRSQSYSDINKGLGEIIERKQERYDQRYGLTAGLTMSIGHLDTDAWEVAARL